jgi:hypothetical protein
MSWNYSQEYACISFDRVVPEVEIRSMLSELAPGILQEYVDTGECFGHAEETAYDYREGNLDLQGATDQLVDIAFLYLDQINQTDEGTELLVRSEYDTEYYDDDLAQEIAKHLFAKSNHSHFIWRRAAFDNCGAYSHQWIGFRAEQQIVLVHTDEYFAKQISVPVSA